MADKRVVKLLCLEEPHQNSKTPKRQELEDAKISNPALKNFNDPMRLDASSSLDDVFDSRSSQDDDAAEKIRNMLEGTDTLAASDELLDQLNSLSVSQQIQPADIFAAADVHDPLFHAQCCDWNTQFGQWRDLFLYKCKNTILGRGYKHHYPNEVATHEPSFEAICLSTMPPRLVTKADLNTTPEKVPFMDSKGMPHVSNRSVYYKKRYLINHREDTHLPISRFSLNNATTPDV
ncbi:hypothetical protein V1522DRAFT_392096 [Lipomyces starkeyi]